MDGQVELEVCANCKREIPHYNYVMHTAHCARNISLCTLCKEPVPKAQLEEHKRQHHSNGAKAAAPKNQQAKVVPKPQPTPQVEHSRYFMAEEKIVAANVAPKPKTSLMPCKYCELELPKTDLEDHENYCGARTEKCEECGELVMYKYRELHTDTNHGFLKLKDEPGPRPTWEPETPRRRPPPLRPFSDFEAFIPAYAPAYTPSFMVSDLSISAKKEKQETSREISRRLDCKTEYIRNLLHDSASITAPFRSNGAIPRTHYNHHKGPAPQPPLRRNPPTELEIPCEFCGLPVPHEDLIQHETGCRPDLARFRRRSPSPDDYFIAPAPSSPEVDLPCEFCADLIPASQLLRHQATCT